STRILERDSKKGFIRGTCRVPGGGLAARDHLWLTREEWQGLIPPLAALDPSKGASFAMPARLSRRLLRFHLLDNTRGEPPYWRAEEVRKYRLTWTVEAVGAREIRLRLEGTALLATAADPEDARRGYDVALHGLLRYDRGRKVVTAFDVVAVGDHWGE